MAGNRQREGFMEHVRSMPKGGEQRGEESTMKPVGTTTIHHMADGSHHVEHHDGEKSDHPTASHMAVHMAAKHDGGEHGHIHVHPEGGATTHHVGLDGEVMGPDEHGTAMDGTDHLGSMLGDGEGMPENENMPEMPGGEAEL